uniref:Uncharacterized protein n=1 Tax=Panagrolaimus sp. JU765 TaxID=591449 RepID=A0AC34RLE0_9BILA
MDDSSDRSAPTYQVQETKSGKLVNRNLKIVWPEVASKKLRDGYVVCDPIGAVNPPPTVAANTVASPSAFRDGRRFIGPATLAEVNERLRQQDFLIFYPIPDISIDELRVEVPLLMAYRSHANKIYYLPIRKERHLWYVILPFGRHIGFTSMSQLIQHYLVYGFFDKETNQIEIFPLNLLEGPAQT